MKRKKRKIEFKLEEVSPLNIDLLRRYVSGDGKQARIVSRYASGLSSRHQRKMSRAIKIARSLNLL
ncbi:MAG: bS18 family ribosomal protein [Candidatus Caenarcaniphilales bacterium]|nr:bS18 family ribosomal protein [Candidatus Caenarcaniphilales bacterium]